MTNQLLVSVLSLGLLAFPALAAETIVRPSKLLAVELPQPIYDRSNLLLLSGGNLQYAFGIDRFQLEAQAGGLNLTPSLTMPLTLQAKSLLWEGNGIGIGAGASIDGQLSGAMGKTQAFLPISYSGIPGLVLGTVPRVTYENGQTAIGAGVGLGWGAGDWFYMAEAHAKDFQSLSNAANNTYMAGAAYFGFGPRTTFAVGLSNNNGATSVFEAIALGF